MKPTIGRFVHFYSQTVADRNPNQPGYGYNGLGRGPYPALVTQLFTDGDGNITYCNLKVFPPFAPPFDEGSVAEKDSTYYQPGRFWEWPPRDEVKPAEKAQPFAAASYVLQFGGDGNPAQRLRFPALQQNDAVVRFSENVTRLDQDATVGGAYVQLYATGADGEKTQHVLGWTKTSNERPTADGEIIA